MTAHDHHRVVAIDGPAAAGKSTVALELARRLDALLFDTGALYRAVTLAAQRRGLPLDDGAALGAMTTGLDISLRPATVDDGRQIDVLVDGDDVTWAIRTRAVDTDVSEVSAHPPVREALLDLQRSIADGVPVVMVGRDIGTVVTPSAGTKIFLDATADERARRRFTELGARGVDANYAAILGEIRERDRVDSTRALSPLKAAPDAIHVNTDGRTVEEIVQEIERIVTPGWVGA